jgi:hypothetical protein
MNKNVNLDLILKLALKTSKFNIKETDNLLNSYIKYLDLISKDELKFDTYILVVKNIEKLKSLIYDAEFDFLYNGLITENLHKSTVSLKLLTTINNVITESNKVKNTPLYSIKFKEENLANELLDYSEINNTTVSIGKLRNIGKTRALVAKSIDKGYPLFVSNNHNKMYILNSIDLPINAESIIVCNDSTQLVGKKFKNKVLVDEGLNYKVITYLRNNSEGVIGFIN